MKLHTPYCNVQAVRCRQYCAELELLPTGAIREALLNLCKWSYKLLNILTTVLVKVFFEI